MKSKYKIKEKVWLYPGEAGSWYFITLDKKVSKEIKVLRYKNNGPGTFAGSSARKCESCSLSRFSRSTSPIKETYGKVHRGFGSIRVTVTVGDTTWKTSVFPNKDGTYGLPIKASVRQKEGILRDDVIEVQLVFE